MPKKLLDETGYNDRQLSPAISSEARQNQMILLAIDLAEKQLRDGTASAQVITHYLKLATAKEKTELEILKKQGELLDAKAEALRAQATQDEDYKRALEAFRIYSGNGGSNDTNIF